MQQLYYNFNVFIYRGENERVCVCRRKMEQKREERWGDKEWNREERLQNITGSRLLFMEFDAKGESSPTVFERSVDVDDSIFFFVGCSIFYIILFLVECRELIEFMGGLFEYSFLFTVKCHHIYKAKWRFKSSSMIFMKYFK